MLIGLTGAAGAGKDSAAQVLCSAGWFSVALADALRIEAAAAWWLDPRAFTDRATKDSPLYSLAAGHGVLHAASTAWLHYCAVQGWPLMEPRSPRWVLQQWGSWRRDSDPQHWIKHVQVWISTQWRAGITDLVVTDVRYANEARAIEALGGHIVRVLRPGLQPLPDDTRSHASEGHTALPVTAEIHNTGDLRQLSAEVWRVVQDLPVNPRPAHA